MRAFTLPATGTLTDVDPDALVCSGCHELVRCEPPLHLTADPGDRAAGFSHQDGGPLCPDRSGRAGEPIETDCPPW